MNPAGRSQVNEVGGNHGPAAEPVDVPAMPPGQRQLKPEEVRFAERFVEWMRAAYRLPNVPNA